MLRLENISKLYGERLIFKSVSLELEPGKILLLAGANGAGKSTLLRIMAGLSRPSGGKVSLDMPAGRVAEAQIGYLGHQTFLYPQLSALENLRFWSRLYGLEAQEGLENALNSALDRVELARFAHEPAGNFSRGMAQRLNLARVLLQRPALLLLDEPGTGLDERARKLLKNEILLARERGAGVVWISHSLAEDLPCADLAALLPGFAGREKGEKRGKIPAGLAYFGPAADYPGQADSGGPSVSTAWSPS